MCERSSAVARVLRGDAPSRRREIARLRDREIARSRAASSWTKYARILCTLRNARRSSGASISAWTSEPSHVLAACIDQIQTRRVDKTSACVSCRLSRRQTCTPNERRSCIVRGRGEGRRAKRPGRTPERPRPRWPAIMRQIFVIAISLYRCIVDDRPFRPRGNPPAPPAGARRFGRNFFTNPGQCGAPAGRRRNYRKTSTPHAPASPR